MSQESTIHVLNDLLSIHFRSLPMYLGTAHPWTHRGDESATDSIEDIISDRKEISARLAEEILSRGGRVDPGPPRMEYGDLNDLSLDYLLRRMIAELRQDVDGIGRCVLSLGNEPVAKALAEEALGTAKGHLASLEEVVLETVTI